MVKNAQLNNIVMFVISFVISFTAIWLVLSHFRHTVTNTIVGADSSDVAFVDEPQSPTVQTQAKDNSGCGCPSCCAVSEVL